MLMKCVVTGAAGFIGSHLCEELLRVGHEVVGLDGFILYYPKPIKEKNLVSCAANPKFHFHSVDLRQDELDRFLDGAEVVFHLAAMPGLIKSWTDFDLYSSCNIQGTHRLLEAVRRTVSKLNRFL